MNSEPIRKVLMTPILMYGCERALLLFSLGGLFYAMLTGIGRASSFLDYAVLFILALCVPLTVIGLRALAKIDPQFSRIYMRSRRYPRIIKASSGVFSEVRKVC
jgi:type IV secretory pathway TrbD component